MQSELYQDVVDPDIGFEQLISNIAERFGATESTLLE